MPYPDHFPKSPYAHFVERYPSPPAPPDNSFYRAFEEDDQRPFAGLSGDKQRAQNSGEGFELDPVGDSARVIQVRKEGEGGVAGGVMGWLGTKPRLIWLTERGVVRGGYRMICR